MVHQRQITYLDALGEGTGIGTDRGRGLLAVELPVELADSELTKVAIHEVVNGVEQVHVALVDPLLDAEVQPPCAPAEPVPTVKSEQVTGQEGLSTTNGHRGVAGGERNLLSKVGTGGGPETDNQDLLAVELSGSAEVAGVHDLALEVGHAGVLGNERRRGLTVGDNQAVDLDEVLLESAVEALEGDGPGTGGVLGGIEHVGAGCNVVVEVEPLGVGVQVADDARVARVIRLVLGELMVRELHGLLVGVHAARLVHVSAVGVRVEVPQASQLGIPVEDHRLNADGEEVTRGTDAGETASDDSNALAPIGGLAQRLGDGPGSPVDWKTFFHCDEFREISGRLRYE